MPIYNFRGFSRRSLDPMVKDWITAGGVATLPTLRRMDTALQFARNNGLLYSNGVGLVRLNFFCGTSLTSALIAQISELGFTRTDTNSGFVADDYRAVGTRGGIFSAATGSPTKYIQMPIAPVDVNSQYGALGVDLCNQYTIPTTTWHSPIGSIFSSTVNAVRCGNTTQELQGFWGNGTAGQYDNGLGYFTPGILAARGSAESGIDAWEGLNKGGLASAPANSTRTEKFNVFAINNAGSAGSFFTHATSNVRLGGYFVWRGECLITQMTLINEMFTIFSQSMGRR